MAPLSGPAAAELAEVDSIVNYVGGAYDKISSDIPTFPSSSHPNFNALMVSSKPKLKEILDAFVALKQGLDDANDSQP